jgi:pilus assembly protein CpaC
VTSCLGLNFSGLIDALAQDNLAHILAEPNLTVMSGQPASFLVGGEFPIPVAQQQGSITVEFKKFGVSLAFVPTVFSDGRINIHVSPEVSQISDQGAVQLTAGNSSIKIPAITVRRAETTVELGSGQSFAIAGLLQDTSNQGVSGLPFLKEIPILGALFRSSSYQRNETELVILVTPVIVRPIDDEAAMHLPTDGFTPASDLERIVESRQIARSRRPVPGRVRIPGDAGFIVQ